MSRTSAALLSAALFAFIHVYPLVWPEIFVSGVLLAIIYERSNRSLLTSMTMHGTFNLVLVLVALSRPPS
jgi:membrane protease YdiL (CAAX protease family)